MAPVRLGLAKNQVSHPHSVTSCGKPLYADVACLNKGAFMLVSIKNTARDLVFNCLSELWNKIASWSLLIILSVLS